MDRERMWRTLERRMGWMAIPNLGVIIVTLQAMGFLLVMQSPAWVSVLALNPYAVFAGEYWRVVTYLALPIFGAHPLFVLIGLYFIYFIMSIIEEHWGAFKTTFYVFVGWALTVFYSLVFGVPVVSAELFEMTLFLAAAALAPEMEILLFFVLPVKLKWLAWLTLAWLGFQFLGNPWGGKIYILVMMANYILFFGPEQIKRMQLAWRRYNFKKKL